MKYWRCFVCVFSFRSCTQTSTVVASLPLTGKTSQRLNLRSSTSRKPKLSASGTKAANQEAEALPDTERWWINFSAVMNFSLLHLRYSCSCCVSVTWLTGRSGELCACLWILPIPPQPSYPGVIWSQSLEFLPTWADVSHCFYGTK